MQIGFRSINTNDVEFLWRLHNLALKKYVAQTWGWDEEWQRADFQMRFNANNGNIIVVDDMDAGFWWTIEKESEILLASVRLLPEFQNKGIGSQLIKNLLSSTHKSVRLQVLKVNPAIHLYEKLGFKIFDENATHFEMRFDRALQ
jgi:ribosomal protein S18 acetylase RimI-like enzyme